MRVISLLIFLLWTLTADAQTAPTTTDTRPSYQPYRYDEDWSVMRDPARHHDVWDPVKYLPLPHDEWYVSLGGEARWRYELLRYPGFGSLTDDRNGYALQRYLLHSDWHFGSRVRAFIEVQSGLETGRAGGPRPTDENRLDLHQAFADVTMYRGERSSVTLRLGRHEVAFGAGRLISAAEGLNVRRSFDGGRLMVTHGTWTWNATTMKLVTSQPGAFDDRRDSGLVWGAGGSGPRAWLGGGSAAAYYIGTRRRSARFDQGTADTTRHSAGFRLWGAAGPIDYDQELILQHGSFGRDPIRAFAVVSELGFSRSSVAWRPRLGGRVVVTSGDGDPQAPKLQSFDPLFPGIAYSGKAALVGPTNLVTFDPSMAISPHANWRIVADWAQFWRTSRRDGLYTVSVVPQRTGQQSAARYVGSQATVEAEVRLTPHVTVWASLVVFRTGPFLVETPPHANSQYVAAHATYRF